MKDDIEKIEERIRELEAWKVAMEAALFNVTLLLKEMHDKLYEDHSNKITDPKITSILPRRMPGDRHD